MAVSPNNSHSSSAGTPDGLFDEATDNTGCTHISALLADPTESDPLLKRFRSLVSWKAQRTHDSLHSAKRRKVRFHISPLVPLPGLYMRVGSASYVWNLWTGYTSPIRVSRLCLLRLLAGRSYSGPFEGRESQILCAYINIWCYLLLLTIRRCRYTARRSILQGMPRRDL